MENRSPEKDLLRSGAQQNAQSSFAARPSAEVELTRAKESLERKTQEIARSSELLHVTLRSIGDAVVTTDREGRVQFLNDVAEALTGWPTRDAQGRPLAEVFRIINEESRQTVENPAERALREGTVVGLANHTILIARDGTEIPIDDSAAPIRDVQGDVHGVVLVFRDIRERKQSEKALRRSEEELAEFFENATIGIHWAGPDGAILRVNRAELEMLGYAREEYLGRHIAEFHADRDVIDEMLRRLHAGEEVRDYEARMRCKDGSLRDVLIDSNVLWEDGRFIHTRCFTRDVTERKQADVVQARLAAIIESSDDAIISKTLEGRILSWNAGAERLFGYTAEEAVGQFITILIPPDRIHEERMILDRLSRGERIEHYETVRRSKQGRLIDISVTISPIRDRAGRIIGASKIARDISARTHAEQTTKFLSVASAALAELTDYESTLQNVANLAVPAFADWSSVDLLEADGSVRRLAVTHADPEKVRLARELHRRYLPRLSDPIGVGGVLHSGEARWVPAIPDEMLVQTAKDEEHLRSIRGLGLRSYICVPLKSRGRLLGALSFATAESGRSFDIDDLHATEDLAHRAVIAIENARLLAALRETDRRKDEFLAMLAHELRNPLSPIRNALEILRAEGPPVPELAWARDIIDRQVTLMTRLVDDLLDVSRITRGRIELRKQQIELATVVNNAVEDSRPVIDERGHQLTLEIPLAPVFLNVDPTRISQVLSNLLNNAAKYMDPGGRIWLTVARDGNQVTVRVKDAGIGIPADMLPKIFDMFTQVDSSLERTQGGLGIGLTLVQRLVEMHGGTVEARSDGPRQGSEFILRLPVVEENDQAGKTEPDAPGSTWPPAKCRILVVDDNQDSARSLAMLLRLMGNEVHAAFDGLEAVAAVSEFRPDVALLDIGLPKLNGYEAARRIREEQGDRLLLIALTGWGQEEDRRRALEAGFNHHMTKPVEVSALQQLLAGRQSQKRAEST